MSGFTLAQVTNRLSNTVGNVQKSIVALSVAAKLKGANNKTVKTALGHNCPSWVSGAFSMADKLIAGLFASPEKRAEILAMTVAAAESEMVRMIEAHMTALGVTAFEKYKAVCHFAESCDAVTEILNPTPIAPETEAATEAATDTTDDTGAPVEKTDVLATAIQLVDGMTLDEMNTLAIHLNARMVAMATVDTEIDRDQLDKAA